MFVYNGALSRVVKIGCDKGIDVDLGAGQTDSSCSWTVGSFIVPLEVQAPAKD